MRHCVKSGRPAHSGTATLELVLCLPILLALVVGIIWLGNSVIAQTEVTIEARHKAWLKRDESPGTALLFLKDDVVSEESTQTVEVSPLFDDVESPESAHDVMAAVWDFEQLPLDKAPNWKQYATAAANAKTAGIQNGYVDARNHFARFKNDARNVWSTIGAALIRQLSGLGNSAKTQLEGGENAGSSKKDQLGNQIQRELSARENQLKRAREALNNLDDEASDAFRNVLKNRIKRLKAEIDDLEADLEALDQ
jgi:outer membrane murein-binding lipoprotein Lpp